MKNNFFRGLKGAFAVKNTPFPWIRAICAGICSSTPVVIGLLLVLSQFLLVFETMAKTVELHHHDNNKHVPSIEGYSKIQQEIISLQNALELFHHQTQLT